MFQRLNNMFVGEINNLPSQEPEFSEKEEEEWILVDFIDSCTSFSVVEEEEEEEEDVIPEVSSVDHSPVFSCLPTSLEHLADASESCFIQFDSCPMEESWFITPPPCFTAGGLTTIKVETSPLENLLIEHPSMSVYTVHNTCHSLNKTNCGEEEEEEEEEEPHDVSNPRSLPSGSRETAWKTSSRCPCLPFPNLYPTVAAPSSPNLAHVPAKQAWGSYGLSHPIRHPHLEELPSVPRMSVHIVATTASKGISSLASTTNRTSKPLPEGTCMQLTNGHTVTLVPVL